MRLFDRISINKNKVLLPIMDIVFIALAFVLSVAFVTQQDFIDTISSLEFIKTVGISFAIHLGIYYTTGMYSNLWTRAGLKDYLKLFEISAICATIINGVFVFLPNTLDIPHVFVSTLIASALMMMVRVSMRSVHVNSQTSNVVGGQEKKNLLIIGAGSAGKIILDDIANNPKLNYKVIGLIDDDIAKKDYIICGSKVLGNRNDIIRIAQSNDVQEIIIAIPGAGRSEIKRIAEICSELHCEVKILPSIDQILENGGMENLINKVKKVSIEDLLERDPIVLDSNEISSNIKDQVILVTGGGGSIGSELCRQIAKFNPKKLVIVDIYENNAYDLQNELNRKFPNLNMDVLIASVRDKNRIDDIFETYEPYIVFHAAAHKHVPLMEDSPGEAIKNNSFGTYNLATLADKHNVKRFVLISTDKAVNPTNVMGASKRLCEMIVQSMQAISKTEFVAVRFGNVLGSNGSVIPLFKKQIEEMGPVTVTHKDITRFFMTIPEAAQLVLQASAYAKGGEIFVLDMGKPVRIYDLAEKIIKLSGYEPHLDIKIEITGLRPGEKLYEELLMDEEGLLKTGHKKIFVGQPIFCDIESIKKDLNYLAKVIETDDPEQIKDAIAQVVPTYRRPVKKVPEMRVVG